MWLVKMLGIVLILLNLPKLVLWTSMLSVLRNIPCALEKHVYSAVPIVAPCVMNPISIHEDAGSIPGLA